MSKYAIIRTGSKQYMVSPGDVLDVELLEGNKGDQIQLGEVLCLQDGDKTQLGKPFLSGSTVQAEIMDQVRGPKVIAYKYKRRKRSTRRKIGHRQTYTRIKITQV
jgi:large subunit ribosomal protein L21